MPGPSTAFLFALFKTWMPATSSAKTRFALLRGHDDSIKSYRDLRPHGRRLDLHSGRARHQIKFELDELRSAVVIVLGPHSRDAIAQAPLQRPHRLPL